jgi:hypothetical protein
MTREVLQQALDYVERHAIIDGIPVRDALRAALAQPVQPEQEPVALPDGKRLILVDGTFDELVYWLDRCEDKGHLENCYDLVEPWANFKYEDYTSPPQREWVELTNEEIGLVSDERFVGALWAQAMLKERNK